MTTEEARAAMLDAIKIIEAHQRLERVVRYYQGGEVQKCERIATKAILALHESATLAELRRLTA